MSPVLDGQCAHTSVMLYGLMFLRNAYRHSSDPLTHTNTHRQLVRALCELHRIGVIHRDIKPENAVFTSQIIPDSRLEELPCLKVRLKRGR